MEIKIGDKSYDLVIEDFNETIDVDNLLQIDYSNVIGEILCFPVILNKLGKLLADAEYTVNTNKMLMDVYEAKFKENQRNGATKAPSVEQLNNLLDADKMYGVLRKKLIESQRTRDYMNSVFWSAKDKSNMLQKLSLTINFGDYDDKIILKSINSITKNI